ncbi:phage tail-collar fiber domain-containing protein [Vibrio parahaemolyticus]|uniref:phage tail-collar fiber domain-containing protein n=1 Tax=Vibrio parahaemolyticus TaxID=670 RepID=UPI0004DF1DCF|nr:phage tail protein [Vibrio parahaemolyticus]
MMTYFSYVTDLGISKIEAAYNAGETINLIEMAIGDSNGAYVEPNSAFTELVNEFARVALNEASTDGHLIHVISYIQPTAETAEKTLREYGIYDDEGDMIIYGAYPESLIPSLASAEHLQLEVENITELENADVVNVTVSPIVPHATETEAGIAKIINDDDIEAGVDDSKILTISKMLKRVATSVKTGVARFATSAEAINGTDTSTMLNPSTGLALLKSRISGALDGTRTDYTASEYALSQINTKASNAQNTADNAVDLANAAQDAADNATGLANAAQDALDAFKAEDNPFPQYLHNDEHATQAQAEEGTSAGVWMSPLRVAQHFLSKLSDKIDGTSHELAASEYALGLVNAKAQEALDDEKLHWVKVASGSCSIPWKNGTSGTLAGTIETGYSASSRKHYSGRFKVNILSNGTAESSDPTNCWWSFRGEPREVTYWSGTPQVVIDVYAYGANLTSGTGGTSWELWELQA